MHRILIFFLLFLSSIAVAMEKNEERIPSPSVLVNLEENIFEDLSEYSEETLEHANTAFFHEVEGNFQELEKPLKKACEKFHKYSLPKYAHWLLGNLDTSKTIVQDIYKACDYLLMAAYRGEEDASEYIYELEPIAKAINYSEKHIPKDEGIMDILEQVEPEERKKWLKGEYSKDRVYPQQIQKAINLLFLSLLPSIDEEICNKFDGFLKNEIIKVEKQTKGYSYKYIDDYINNKLKMVV